MVQPEHAAAQAVAPLQLVPLDPAPSASPPLGFPDFFTASWQPLIKTAMVYGATLPEAEDAAADALTYMLSRWPIEGHPLAYAKKATLSYFFRAKKHGAWKTAYRLIERGHVLQREDAEDERLAELEGCDWLDEVLSQLTPAQREVLQQVADGLNYQEIARAIGKSPEVVRQRMAAARARLTKILAPDGSYRQPETTQAQTSREEAR